MNPTDFNNIMDALIDLKNDSGVPKNLRGKITEMLEELKCCTDNSITVNKLLNELEEISSDINLQPFVRTQLYNISSMLETFH